MSRAIRGNEDIMVFLYFEEFNKKEICHLFWGSDFKILISDINYVLNRPNKRYDIQSMLMSIGGCVGGGYGSGLLKARTFNLTDIPNIDSLLSEAFLPVQSGTIFDYDKTANKIFYKNPDIEIFLEDGLNDENIGNSMFYLEENKGRYSIKPMQQKIPPRQQNIAALLQTPLAKQEKPTKTRQKKNAKK